MRGRNSLKVLHIISGDLWGGAEAMAYQLLFGLNRLDSIDLHLIIFNNGRLETTCRQAGIKTYLINEQKHSMIGITLKSIKIARKIEPDIIHSHRYKENILSYFVSCFCGKPKLMSTQHGRAETEISRFLRRLIMTFNHALMMRIFEKVVAVSKDTSDYLSDIFGRNKNKLSIIYNGIQIPSSSHKMKENSESGIFTIGSAGRLFPVKKFDTLIHIAKSVCKAKPNVLFKIAGEGPERTKLEKLITKFGLENKVILLGHIENMHDFYNGLNLYINTSKHEGTPISVLEAMAIWLPVISFNVAGLREIISNGTNGCTIPEGDNSRFSSRIVEFIENPKKLRDFRLAARQTIVERFSDDIMVKKYYGLYKEMVK